MCDSISRELLHIAMEPVGNVVGCLEDNTTFVRKFGDGTG